MPPFNFLRQAAQDILQGVRSRRERRRDDLQAADTLDDTQARIQQRRVSLGAPAFGPQDTFIGPQLPQQTPFQQLQGLENFQLPDIPSSLDLGEGQAPIDIFGERVERAAGDVREFFGAPSQEPQLVGELLPEARERLAAEAETFVNVPSVPIERRFAGELLRAPGRAIAGLGIQGGVGLTGLAGVETPGEEREVQFRTPAARFLLGNEPVPATFERGTRGLEEVGVGESAARSFGPLAGAGLAALDISDLAVPGSGTVAKEAVEQGVRRIARSVSPAEIRAALQSIFGTRGGQESVERLTRELFDQTEETVIRRVIDEERTALEIMTRNVPPSEARVIARDIVADARVADDTEVFIREAIEEVPVRAIDDVPTSIEAPRRLPTGRVADQAETIARRLANEGQLSVRRAAGELRVARGLDDVPATTFSRGQDIIQRAETAAVAQRPLRLAEDLAPIRSRFADDVGELTPVAREAAQRRTDTAADLVRRTDRAPRTAVEAAIQKEADRTPKTRAQLAEREEAARITTQQAGIKNTNLASYKLVDREAAFSRVADASVVLGDDMLEFWGLKDLTNYNDPTGFGGETMKNFRNSGGYESFAETTFDTYASTLKFIREQGADVPDDINFNAIEVAMWGSVQTAQELMAKEVTDIAKTLERLAKQTNQSVDQVTDDVWKFTWASHATDVNNAKTAQLIAERASVTGKIDDAALAKLQAEADVLAAQTPSRVAAREQRDLQIEGIKRQRSEALSNLRQQRLAAQRRGASNEAADIKRTESLVGRQFDEDIKALRDESSVLSKEVTKGRQDAVKLIKKLDLTADEFSTELQALDDKFELFTEETGELNFAGMTNSQAAERVTKFNEQYGNNQLALDVVRLTQQRSRRTLDMYKDFGLITDKQHKIMRDLYPNHVNLFKEQEKLSDDFFEKNFMPNPMKKLVGSKREPINVITGTYVAAQQVIARAGKNNALDGFAKFIERFGEDLPLGGKRIEGLGTVRKEGVIPKELQSLQYGFFRKGEKYVITFDNATVKASYEGAVGRWFKDFIRSKPGRHPIVNFASKIALVSVNFMRLMSQLVTRLAIPRFKGDGTFTTGFSPRNFVRDSWGAAAIQGAQIPIPRAGIKDRIKTVWDSFRITAKYHLKGPVDAETRFYEEFLRLGGTTGGFAASLIEKSPVNLEQILNTRASFVKNSFAKTIDLVDKYNAVFEETTRFHSYLEARRLGGTPEVAAYLGKTNSINFNGYGRIGPVGNMLFMFFNPALQGVNNMARILQNPRQALKVVGGVGAAVASVNFYNESREPDWEDGLPIWKRSRFINIYRGRNKKGDMQYWSIPIPYEFIPIVAVANGIDDSSTGKASVAGSMGEIMRATFQATSPVQAPNLGQALTPDGIPDLIVSLFQNINNFGDPIRPEGTFGQEGWERTLHGFTSQPGEQTALNISKWLNENIGSKGKVDISPEVLYHIYSSTVIGAVGDTSDLLIGLAEGKTPGEIEKEQREIERKLQGQAGSGLENYNKQRKITDDIYFQLRNRVPDSEHEDWLRQYAIDNVLSQDEWDSITQGLKYREDSSGNPAGLVVKEIGLNLVNSSSPDVFQFATRLYEMTRSEDEVTRDKASRYLLAQRPERRKAFVTWQMAFEGAPITDSTEFIDRAEELGVRFDRNKSGNGKYRTADGTAVNGSQVSSLLSSYEKKIAQANRIQGNTQEMYEVLKDTTSRMESGDAYTVEELQSALTIANFLFQNNMMTESQLKEQQEKVADNWQTPLLNELVKNYNNPGIDNATVVLPRIDELTNDNQKKFWQSVGIDGLLEANLITN